jgi:hypothetical protein
MLEKSFEELLTTRFGNERVGDCLSESIGLIRDTVGHAATLGVSPTVIDDMALGGIGRQELHGHPMSVDIAQPPSGFFVPTETIPAQQQGSLKRTVQLLDKGTDIGAGDMPGSDEEIEAQPLCRMPQPASSRETATRRRPSSWSLVP